MVLYSSTKFWHYQPFSQYSTTRNILCRCLIYFKTNFKETPIQREKFWVNSRIPLPPPQKKDLKQYLMTPNIRYRCLTHLKRNFQETLIQRESFWIISRFFLHPQKNSFVFVIQISRCKGLNDSVTQKFRFRLLRNIKKVYSYKFIAITSI